VTASRPHDRFISRERRRREGAEKGLPRIYVPHRQQHAAQPRVCKQNYSLDMDMDKATPFLYSTFAAYIKWPPAVGQFQTHQHHHSSR
jgi:hypothetical protein